MLDCFSLESSSIVSVRLSLAYERKHITILVVFLACRWMLTVEVLKYACKFFDTLALKGHNIVSFPLNTAQTQDSVLMNNMLSDGTDAYTASRFRHRRIDSASTKLSGFASSLREAISQS